MLKKLKSLFVIDEETPEEKLNNKMKPKAKESSSPRPAAKKQSSSSSPVVSKASSINVTGKVTTKFLDALLKAMDEQNLEGFDYLEYKQSLQSLSKMSMDEATRYQSAFAMAQTMGASANNLTNSAKHYLNVLAEEEKKFEQALLNQRNRQINDKQEELKRLKMSIESHQQQIEKLNKEIQSYKKKMDTLTNTLAASEAKLEGTKNNFLVTYQKLVDQIQSDVDKMNQYLK